MEMVMSVNYVEMTDEEMMYVDGGRLNFFGQQWWNHVNTVANGIDITLIWYGIAGKGTISAGKHAIKNNRNKIINAIGSVLGNKYTRYPAAAIDTALILSSYSSIGGLIANGLDYVDGSKNNYVFG